jgi:hypothetical protein
MKLKSIAIFTSLLLICGAPTSLAFAQSPAEQKEEQKKEQKDEPVSPADLKRFSVKLFELKYRDPISLNQALMALGSGAKGTMMSPNPNLRTLTVRDFPENIAAIEDALKRLDVPEKFNPPNPPASLEFQLHLIAASMTQSDKSALPKNLEPVVEQLKSTLKFTNYRYVSSALNRVSDRGKVESSGVTGSLFPTPAGIANSPENPSFYQYNLSRITLTQDATGKEIILIDSFKFGVSVPIRIGSGGGNIQYRDIGLTTLLSLREGEMAVVGTANIGGSDEAIIVVISVKKVK